MGGHGRHHGKRRAGLARARAFPRDRLERRGRRRRRNRTIRSSRTGDGSQESGVRRKTSSLRLLTSVSIFPKESYGKSHRENRDERGHDTLRASGGRVAEDGGELPTAGRGWQVRRRNLPP